MHSWKLWLDRSLTAQAVLIFALGTGLTALFRQGSHPLVWVVQGAFYTAISVGILAVQRRRAGRVTGKDPRGVAELTRRIRHRDVPSDPEEREAMRRLVADQLGRLERAGRWLPYWLGFMGLVVVGMLVLGAVSGSLVFPLVFTVAMAAFCYGVFRMRRYTLALYRHMRSALEDPS
ncbi:MULTISPECIES: hypothetical protein [unclassified Streptomyces]|uniref:hypothetical protein n=1 Tax=unclassified Streptomyces TaxID=2593676 RepID=UPI0035D58B36